jgi:predicted Zn-dependent peptidase
VINSTFPDKEIEKEKEVVTEEINSYLDNPAELIFDEFDEQVFSHKPIGRGILGTPDSVRSFTGAAIRKFISKNYNTSGMVFCSVGEVSPAEAQRLFSKYFSQMPANNSIKRRSLDPEYTP